MNIKFWCFFFFIWQLLCRIRELILRELGFRDIFKKVKVWFPCQNCFIPKACFVLTDWFMMSSIGWGECKGYNTVSWCRPSEWCYWRRRKAHRESCKRHLRWKHLWSRFCTGVCITSFLSCSVASSIITCLLLTILINESLRRYSQRMGCHSWLAVKTWFHGHGSLMTWTTFKLDGSRSPGRRSLFLTFCFTFIWRGWSQD